MGLWACAVNDGVGGDVHAICTTPSVARADASCTTVVSSVAAADFPLFRSPAGPLSQLAASVWWVD